MHKLFYVIKLLDELLSKVYNNKQDSIEHKLSLLKIDIFSFEWDSFQSYSRKGVYYVRRI